jgi:hypothetical protein
MGGGGGTPGNGNGRRGDEFPPPTSFSNCEAIRFEAVLMSPKPAVVAKLIVGQILFLRLSTQQERPIVEVVTDRGETAGNVTSSYLIQLIECMERGHSYVAQVLELDGGACRVLVHHAEH